MKDTRWFSMLVAVAGVMGLIGLSAANAGLVAHWKLDDGTGSSTAVDSAGGHTGALTNMEAGADWVAGHTGGAGDLDLDFYGTN